MKTDTDAYINSGGVAVLIQILSQARQHNQIIAIAGVSRYYKKILSMVGITKFASIHKSVESAIQTMA